MHINAVVIQDKILYLTYGGEGTITLETIDHYHTAMVAVVIIVPMGQFKKI